MVYNLFLFFSFFSPKKHTVNKKFKRINIYRSTADFDNVSRMKPHVSLQNPAQNSYKDLYPPVNVELYYAVTVEDGEGKEGKDDVEVKKVKASRGIFTDPAVAGQIRSRGLYNRSSFPRFYSQ